MQDWWKSQFKKPLKKHEHVFCEPGAQIKLAEVWKAMNDDSNPLKLNKISHVQEQCVTRAATNGD